MKETIISNSMEIANLRFRNPNNPEDERSEPLKSWRKTTIIYEIDYMDDLDAEAICIVNKDELEKPILEMHSLKRTSTMHGILDDEMQVRVTLGAKRLPNKK